MTFSVFAKWVGRELRALLPVWLFFFVAFGLLRMTVVIVFKEQGYELETASLVLLGSLVMAKSFMFMNVFRFMNRYEHRPLLYSVLWKTSIYSAGALLVFFCEQVIENLFRSRNFPESVHFSMKEMTTPHIFISAVWMAILLFMFCGIQEMKRAIGYAHFRELWLGPPRRPSNITQLPARPHENDRKVWN